jgi:hypothetical protein
MKLSYAIDVDLEVFKALTSRISVEGQLHNDVLRDLLGLDSPMEPGEPESIVDSVFDEVEKAKARFSGVFHSRGLSLPSGTALRAKYKGKTFYAKIIQGSWIDNDGKEHSSPSSAAGYITKTMVNGLRFWEARCPGDSGWRRLDIVRDGYDL